jgi:hypothetical protein
VFSTKGQRPTSGEARPTSGEAVGGAGGEGGRATAGGSGELRGRTHVGHSF